MELPELPPCEIWEPEEAYTPAQMRAYAEEAVRGEREACARVCEARVERLQAMKAAIDVDGSAYYDHHVLNGDIGCLADIAAAIRSRSEQGKEQG